MDHDTDTPRVRCVVMLGPTSHLCNNLMRP
jgi:hypothetical protein